MKILFVTQDRRAAQHAAQTLHGIAPNGTFTWTQTPASALRWVHDNRDAAAVIIEGEGGRAASFVAQVRSLGPAIRIVVVPPGRLATWLAGFRTGRPPDVRKPSEEAVQRAGLQRSERLTVALQGRLLELEAALDDSREILKAEKGAAAERLARREAELGAALARAAESQVAVEQRLAESRADAEQARRRAAADAEAAILREAALKERLAQEAAARNALQEKVAAAEAARLNAERRYSNEAAAGVARLDELQRAYDAALTEQTAVRSDFERQLAEGAAARQQLVSDAAAAAARQEALEERLAQETAAREVLQQTLTALESARSEAARRHAAQMAETGARLADLQTRYDVVLTDHAAARIALEQRLADAAGALQRLALEAEAAAARQRTLEERLGQETNRREALEQSLTAAEAAREDTDRRHAKELAEASARFAELRGAYDAAIEQHAAAAARQRTLEERLGQETTTREALEQSRAAAEAAREDTDRRHANELAEASARFAELTKAYDTSREEHAAACRAFEQRLTHAAAALEAAAQLRTTLESDLVESRTSAARTRRRLVNLTVAHRRRSRATVAELERQLYRERADAERVLAQTSREREEERRESERARVAGEAELRRVNAEYEQARRSLDHLGMSFAALERVAGENALERARLETVVAERDAQLKAQAEHHAAAERGAADALAAVRRELGATRQELGAARARATALQSEAERGPVLQKQLDESQKESRRLFERAPYGLCRLTADGAVMQANHSVARLLGYRKAEDMRGATFGTAFECAADLRWLIERAGNTGTTQTIETTLRGKDGRRIDVRLHAFAQPDRTVEVGVQDITSERALEVRLREAHRMEAVGRLASEVAVTCDMVLRDVTDAGREWLATADGNPELRNRAEQLLGEVARAAGFLRQFSAYGRKQISALAPVPVQRVIRDLAPVLKRVAGDDIEWVLPKMSAPLNVDVDAEHVERVLVNVASYARERMPHGGRIKIDVATTVVGRDFIARYPNVRPGPHVLVTIAEVKGSARTAVAASPSPSDRTGVDLGALLALLGNCGGHLWIAAERSGNMTLKVHLPRRVTQTDARADAPPSPTHRVRQLAGWFRH